MTPCSGEDGKDRPLFGWIRRLMTCYDDWLCGTPDDDWDDEDVGAEDGE